ncbi:extracellular solute-binding protein [Patescibacteria group bacterium]|nr:extracellular solute-binding protein [Patescibacteria group bacterium]
MNRTFSVKQLIVKALSVTLLISVLGAGCTQGPDQSTVDASKKVTLTIWSAIDDQDVYAPILTDYRKAHPYVSIEYRRFRLEEYENQLINALAEDRGPDVFLIHNTWVGKYLPKILPMPASTKVAEQVMIGTINPKPGYQIATAPTVTVRKFKADYPDVVTSDFIRKLNVSTVSDKTDYQDRILGMPLSVDTLGMYVNKDLLNTAGISTIPESWEDFQAAVKKLVKTDAQGEIIQSGAALGTGYNVVRAPDILSVLMMQNGAVMTDESGAPTFMLTPAALNGIRETPPAYQAISFYTDFANPGKEVYTWNAKQPNSLDAFVQGKVAFYFGYAYDLPTIKARAPKLNLTIAKLPQITGNPEVNFANYWSWTVSKKTKMPDVAWNFLNFMRTPEESQKFLDLAKRPAALRSQLGAQLENEDIGVFAAQVLTSKSWYRGTDSKAADDAFSVLIEQALIGAPEEVPKFATDATDKISQTMYIR